MRRTPVLVSSVVSVVMLSAVLTGCTASPDDVTACTPLIQPGDASALVTATGSGDALPTVDIPAPLTVTASERSVITEGEGLVAAEGMTVDYDAVLVDASTGQLIQRTSYDGTPHLLRTGDEGAVWEAMVCAQPGSRIAVTTTIGDSGLATGTTSEVDAKRTIVAVVDVHGVYLGKANGSNGWPSDGMPVVVTAPDGTVGITIPSGIDIPAENRTATIKRGSGAVLAEGDEVVAHLASWSWSSDDARPSAINSTWNSNPQVVALEREGDRALAPVIADALEGHKVGSQVLIVVAPTAENPDATIYVIDVLGIRPPAN